MVGGMDAILNDRAVGAVASQVLNVYLRALK
jgi:hypothetical protein